LHPEGALERDLVVEVFLDQFVLGDFGSASLEAMALGKPAVCYIKPTLAAQYPPDLPIVKATQETLTDVLEQLIANGKWRSELGRRGRAYVEKYHDAFQVTCKLKDIYQELLQKYR
jgi:glycosyltransferase involved in cell wall biosynthesis